MSDLGRYQRMADRAAKRAKLASAIERDNGLTRAEESAKYRAKHEGKLNQLLAEGPPDGCMDCYQIAESWPWNGYGCWYWDHRWDASEVRIDS